MKDLFDLDLTAFPSLTAGVDEAGRGPLAGPVVAAAVILDVNNPIEGLADSKQLSEKKRIALEPLIKSRALCWAVARAEVDEIDEINILRASLLAMQRAVAALQTQPEHLLVDGNQMPPIKLPMTTVIKGDSRVACIAAASILAKQYRDREMLEMDLQYPGYGFARHKGYPTQLHMQALELHGVTLIHRKSFAPVRRCIEGTAQK
jgi:ribonuclease HII